MIPVDFLSYIVDPSLRRLRDWTGVVFDDRTRVLLMAIAGQESGWAVRRQVPGGEARGYWQFELGGAVTGLFDELPSSTEGVCKALDIPYAPTAVYEAVAWNDTLACCMARLLLWSDPAPLPAVGNADAAWDYYLKLWRPGVPRRETWQARYSTALLLTNP